MLAPRYTFHSPRRARDRVPPSPFRYLRVFETRARLRTTNSLRTTRTKNRFFLAAAVRLRSDGPSRRNSSYRPNYRDLPSATNKSHPRSLSLASRAKGSTRRHRVHQTRNYQRETAFSEPNESSERIFDGSTSDDETVDRKAERRVTGAKRHSIRDNRTTRFPTNSFVHAVPTRLNFASCDVSSDCENSTVYLEKFVSRHDRYGFFLRLFRRYTRPVCIAFGLRYPWHS